jgi:DNA-binding LacI/PurR family transcriptional regulator
MDQASPNVTMMAIAKRLGVSPATVSYVLNGKGRENRISKATIEAVEDAVRRLNFRPNHAARQLAGGRSNAVGVLIGTEAPADPRLIGKMETLAARRGIRFMVGHALGTRERVKEYLDDFFARGVDAIISIFHSHPEYGKAVLPELSRFPRVVYYEEPKGARALRSALAGACWVAPDYYRLGQLVTQHLIDRKRQRIAIVLRDTMFASLAMRYLAYRDTLKAARRKVDRRLAWIMDRQPGMQWTDEFSAERARQAVDNLVVAGRADAIVAMNDTYAARLLAALRQRGLRVPDDVAVVGGDNFDVGTLVEPELTTTDLRIDDLAQETVKLLFNLLDHGSVPEGHRAVVVQPTLIVRGST